MLRRTFITATSLVGASVAFGKASVSKKDSKNNKYISDIETDVLVVGAGPAGVPAAISAARQGAKVVLLEEDALAGGAPVDMFVSYPCGGPQNIGIFSEIKKRAVEKYDISGGKRHALWFFSIDMGICARGENRR